MTSGQIPPEKRAPLYNHVRDDVVVIGIRGHRTDARKQPAELKKFLDEVATCRSLLMEGSKVGYEKIWGKSLPYNYESHAMRSHDNRHVFFLEDRADCTAALESFGMQPEATYLYEALRSLPERRPESENDLIGMGYIVELTLSVKKATDFSCRSMPIRRTLVNFIEATSSHQWDLLDCARESFERYRSGVRNYSFIVPRAKLMSESLRGKKGVIVGSSHVPALVSGFKGELAKPMQWNEHVDRLPKETRDIILKLEARLGSL